MAFNNTAVAAKDGNGTAITGGIRQHDTSGAGTGPNMGLHGIADGAGGEILGRMNDAKNAASDTTSVSFMSVFKQISFSIQALATAFGAALTRGAGATDANTQRFTLASDSAGVIPTGSQASPSSQYLSTVAAGDIAGGATDSGNPLKIGGLAKTVLPAAAADGQRVSGLFDKQGKQVVVGSLRELKGQQKTTITTTTETAITAAGGANVFVDLYGLIVTNTSAAAVTVTFRDVVGGTARFSITVPANDTRGFMLPAADAVTQSTANSQWSATLGASATSIDIATFTIKNN
ncbi:hypothetical protein ACQR1Y_12160 [Bradyrhizobium sp. HKCCYLRH3099]|uniref:hypothetical protein n=1 Tax=unclassified Bradyrhizobium TaxID=2631580 RepID=UPI003EB9872E